MSTTRYPTYLEDIEHGRKLREEQDAVGVGQQFPDQLVEDDHLARVADDAREAPRECMVFPKDITSVFTDTFLITIAASPTNSTIHTCSSTECYYSIFFLRGTTPCLG